MHTRFTRALAAVICCIVLVASCARLEVFAASTSNTKYSNLDSSKWNLVWSDEFSGIPSTQINGVLQLAAADLEITSSSITQTQRKMRILKMAALS